ncbi:MAG: hypothetical protein K2W82_17185 [Candidatus Obscuribacterales bacterium]|nr:hypothetical protein [Candidatus Obscuribacterales bacterium]
MNTKTSVAVLSLVAGLLFGFHLAVMFASLFTTALPWLFGIGVVSAGGFAYWAYSDVYKFNKTLNWPLKESWGELGVRFMGLIIGAALIASLSLQALAIVGTANLILSIASGLTLSGLLILTRSQ